jgi:hypothetical protein
MTYTWPLRLTMRHLAHRLRTEGDTFIITAPYFHLAKKRLYASFLGPSSLDSL